MSRAASSESGRPPATLPEPTGAFAWRQAPWGWLLECTALSPYARHAFTARDLAPGPAARADEHWAALAAWLGVSAEALWRMQQVHGCQTLIVANSGSVPETLPTADALVSGLDHVALAVKVADCVPILLAARDGRGVGAVHAGWRGTAQGVAASAVAAMTRELGCAAADLVVAVGPSIGPCCYQVGPEVRDGFTASVPGAAVAASVFSSGEGDRWQLDLWRANHEQLRAAGVPSTSIHVAALCTSCRVDRFFSYRREGPKAGRMVAAIRARRA